jgi:thiol-disulfide isomerase/thioredoxin
MSAPSVHDDKDAAEDDHRLAREEFMRYRRLRPGTAGTRRAIGLVFLVAIGCSPQEELKPDPGVSPFYPGPSAEKKAPGGAGPAADLAAAGGPSDLEGPLRPQDVERQLRIALRASEKGDLARATAMLDRILALEPVNREALLGRAAVALTQAQKAASPEERLAAIEKAGAVARTLRRAYERSNQREIELFSKVIEEEMRTNVNQGRLERAVAIIKEAHEAGFDPFDAIEHDPDLAKLRSWKGYQDLVSSVDAANLAKARERVKDEFARSPNYVLDFHVKGLDGKPLTLEQFKGKVLLVDIWGTWCKPCREAIPGLIQLYRKQRRRGFEVIGLDYEQNATDPEKTREFVKQFVKESGIPYPIAMLDDELHQKIPNLQAFPTTLIIDRTGKVRIQLVGGGPEAHATIDAAVEVLLAEPTGDAQAAAKPKADNEGGPKAPSPPPSEPKGKAKGQ